MGEMMFRLGKLGWSIIIILIYLLIGKILAKGLEKFATKNSLTLERSNRIKKFIEVFVLSLLVITVTLVWGFNMRDFFVAMATVFSIIGVAFFASWSNLSNISSGIIIFFNYKIKIGDRVWFIYVDERLEGVVHEMKLFYIEIITDDGDLIIYPNNQILHNAIRVINVKK